MTIIFNNEDRARSPVGYEDQKKITITRQVSTAHYMISFLMNQIVVGGGKNKYIINGTTATQQKVFDLFQSVSLNVNNPHFLIMQGKITKVLNMKPPEILAMVLQSAQLCVPITLLDRRSCGNTHVWRSQGEGN